MKRIRNSCFKLLVRRLTRSFSSSNNVALTRAGSSPCRKPAPAHILKLLVGLPQSYLPGEFLVTSVAVVGATGVVGEIMRQVLSERDFPLRSVKFLASPRSAGKSIEFKGKSYVVEPICPE